MTECMLHRMTTMLPWLAAAGFLAGAIDAMAGGGGLVAIPALLAGGVDPVTAVATSKLQSSIGSSSAMLAFYRRGHVALGRFVPAAAASFLGALCGARLLGAFQPDFVASIVPVLLLLVAGFFARGTSNRRSAGTRGRPGLMVPLAFLIGAYDGFFGPGAGALLVAALLAACSLRLVDAIANAKYLNLASNLAALLVFSADGRVLWSIGLAMGGASLLGAQVGARLTLGFGARIARPVLILMCLTLTLKVLSTREHLLGGQLPSIGHSLQAQRTHIP